MTQAAQAVKNPDTPSTPCKICPCANYCIFLIILILLTEKFISLLHLEKHWDSWERKLTVSFGTSYYKVKSLVSKGFIIWPKRELFLAGPTQEIRSRQEMMGLFHLIWLPITMHKLSLFISSCLPVDSAT